MPHLHHVSHPEVVIDPDVPVPQWSLSAEGRRRAELLTAAPWIRREVDGPWRPFEDVV